MRTGRCWPRAASMTSWPGQVVSISRPLNSGAGEVMTPLLALPGPVEVVAEDTGGHLSPLQLSTFAVSALIEEAELTPKPALVDRRGSGAHHDLDLPLLRRSARALHRGFVALARAAVGEPPTLRLREQIGRIGRGME